MFKYYLTVVVTISLIVGLALAAEPITFSRERELTKAFDKQSYTVVTALKTILTQDQADALVAAVQPPIDDNLKQDNYEEIERILNDLQITKEDPLYVELTKKLTTTVVIKEIN